MTITSDLRVNLLDKHFAT